MASNPILFLDVDGVLNSTHFYETTPPPPEKADADTFFRSMIDPAPVGILRWLLDRSRASVVLSSSWRRVMEPEALAKILREKGLGYDWPGFIGETPRVVKGQKLSERVTRGREIKAWLDENRKLVGKRRFVILDDDNDMDPVARHLVRTDPKLGLRKGDAHLTLRMMVGARRAAEFGA